MKYINLAKKFAQQKYQQLALAATAMAISAHASAEGVDISQIGQSAATEIAKFAIMISAIGAAILSVVVLIQGFRIAFRMIRSGS